MSAPTVDRWVDLEADVAELHPSWCPAGDECEALNGVTVHAVTVERWTTASLDDVEIVLQRRRTDEFSQRGEQASQLIGREALRLQLTNTAYDGEQAAVVLSVDEAERLAGALRRYAQRQRRAQAHRADWPETEQ